MHKTKLKTNESALGFKAYELNQLLIRLEKTLAFFPQSLLQNQFKESIELTNLHDFLVFALQFTPELIANYSKSKGIHTQVTKGINYLQGYLSAMDIPSDSTL